MTFAGWIAIGIFWGGSWLCTGFWLWAIYLDIHSMVEGPAGGNVEMNPDMQPYTQAGHPWRMLWGNMVLTKFTCFPGALLVPMFATECDDAGNAARAACEARCAYLRSLPTFPAFGEGWLSRVDHLQMTAVGWATNG